MEDRQIPDGVEKWHGFELDEDACQEGNFNVLQILVAVVPFKVRFP